MRSNKARTAANDLAGWPPRQADKRVRIIVRAARVRIGKVVALERGLQRHGADCVDYMEVAQPQVDAGLLGELLLRARDGQPRSSVAISTCTSQANCQCGDVAES